MSTAYFYALVGVGLFTLGLYALIVHAHLLRKILAINVLGNGVFLVLVAWLSVPVTICRMLCPRPWSSPASWLPSRPRPWPSP